MFLRMAIPVNGSTSFGHRILLTLILVAGLAVSQTNTPAAAALEFPVIMRQKVIAGKTPVGTKLRARLTVATLVEGTVVPVGADLSGEVVESQARSTSETASEPSRLAIRMDSARWKNGSLALTLFLTAWYYPVQMPKPANQDLSAGSPDAGNDTRLRTGGAYPGARNPASPFPDSGAQSNRTIPEGPAPDSNTPQHRVLMKDVESTRGSDGVVTLTSKHTNIKLDKSTTYVLATSDLATGPG